MHNQGRFHFTVIKTASGKKNFSLNKIAAFQISSSEAKLHILQRQKDIYYWKTYQDQCDTWNSVTIWKHTAYWSSEEKFSPVTANTS